MRVLCVCAVHRYREESSCLRFVPIFSKNSKRFYWIPPEFWLRIGNIVLLCSVFSSCVPLLSKFFWISQTQCRFAAIVSKVEYIDLLGNDRSIRNILEHLFSMRNPTNSFHKHTVQQCSYNKKLTSKQTNGTLPNNSVPVTQTRFSRVYLRFLSRVRLINRICHWLLLMHFPGKSPHCYNVILNTMLARHSMWKTWQTEKINNQETLISDDVDTQCWITFWLDFVRQIAFWAQLNFHFEYRRLWW